MSIKDRLLSKLKKEKAFIPFNDNYDFQTITNFVKGNSIVKNESVEKAVYSIYFNQYYITFKDLVCEVFNKYDISRSSAIEILVTASNRDYYLSRVKFANKISQSNEIFYDQILNTRIESNIEEYGSINLQGGLEASNDGLNAVLNYLLKINFFGNTNVELDCIDDLCKVLMFANTYIIIKGCYDTAVWEDYDIKKTKNPNEIYIKCNNEDLTKINKIGFFRLQRNLMAYKAMIVLEMQSKTQRYSSISNKISSNKNPKRLKKVYIENKELKYKIGDGKDKASILNDMLIFSELTAYYSFIKDEYLPNFPQINLFDILNLYSELKLLFSKVQEIKIDETTIDKENFYKYSFFIPYNEIKNYLIKKTKYSVKQINQALDLLIHKDGYYNLWQKSLIRIDEKIYPILYPFLHGNLFRYIDYWLEAGGFDLDRRGKLFENFIKNELENSFKRKAFFLKIIKQNTFKAKDGQTEEIDLIIELKNITIIAEVKCIKYPVDTRDFSNIYKRLDSASVQINRKVEFLEKNDFKNSNPFLNKKIIKLLITNFPEFSGAKFNGVAVTDFSLMENYFINGKLEEGVAFFKEESSRNKNYKKIVYYKSEEEFNDNLELFFNFPTPIKEKWDSIKKSKQLISLPNIEPKIFMDYFNFTENITLSK